MTKTPDTYTTIEEAVEVIAQGVRGTGCNGNEILALGEIAGYLLTLPLWGAVVVAEACPGSCGGNH